MKDLNEYLQPLKFGQTFVISDEHLDNGFLRKEVLKFINDNRITSFNITYWDNFTGNDLNFMLELPQTQCLFVNKLHIDVTAMSSLVNLEKLYLEENVIGPIDFTELKNLSEATLVVNKKRETIKNCIGLRKLVALRGSKFDNLQLFKEMNSLKKLEVICVSLKSLEGIEYLENLEILDIYTNRKISDLSPLTGCKKLKQINFEKLSALVSIEPLLHINSLENLFIRGCKNINDADKVLEMKNLVKLAIVNSRLNSIAKISEFTRLKILTFGDTLIEDYDLTPMLKLQHLEWFQLYDKKQYNLTESAIRDAFNIDIHEYVKKQELLKEINQN